MAIVTAYMGGGKYAHCENGLPIVLAADTWSDRLAAKAAILEIGRREARAHGAAWVQLRDQTGTAITARQPVAEAEV